MKMEKQQHYLKSFFKFVAYGFLGKKETKSFYNRIANVYDSAMKDQRIYIKEIIKYLPQGKKGLDLGCGTGLSMLELMTKTYSVVGVDFSKEMLNKAREKGLENLVQANILELPFENNSFDCAISTGVLRHLPLNTEEQFLKGVYRVLKHGGIFATEAIKYSKLRKVQCRVYDLFMKILGYDERIGNLSVENFEKWGKNAGFSRVFNTPLPLGQNSYAMYLIK